MKDITPSLRLRISFTILIPLVWLVVVVVGSGSTTSSEEELTTRMEDDPWFLTEDASSHVGDFDAFWEALQCDTVFDQLERRPIPSRRMWVFLRGLYFGIVGPQQSTIDVSLDDDRTKETSQNPPETTTTSIDGNSFLVPIKVEYVPGKGRAVIAVEDIPQGTQVCNGAWVARFLSPMYFRRFLSSLPRDLACDVMIWSFVEDHVWEDEDDDSDEDGRPTLSVDLDEAAFMNKASRDEGSNIENENCIASRMIFKGEELLLDYSEFEKEFSWKAAGFGSINEGNPNSWAWA